MWMYLSINEYFFIYIGDGVKCAVNLQSKVHCQSCLEKSSTKETLKVSTSLSYMSMHLNCI